MKVKNDNIYRLLVCGGRHFDYYNIFEYYLNNIVKDNNVEIISGHASGADSLGERYAKENGLQLKIFPANWGKYGRAAGPIRNKEMIDYIKNFENKAVVAFMSKNSIGTRNTVALAKKENIPCYVIEYDNEDLTFNDLTEGIRVDSNGDVIFDWENDNENDLISLKQTNIRLTKFKKNIYFFGYKLNKTQDNKGSIKKVLNYLKTSNDENIKQMVDLSVESLYTNSPIKHYNYIIEIPSSSNINKNIVQTIKANFDDNFKLIVANKLPISELNLDTKEIEKSVKYVDKEKMYIFLKRYLLSLKKKENFRISNIKPQFRKFFTPMITFDGSKIDNNESTNILIVDDIKTTGQSLTDILNILDKVGFKGTITIFTLIYNR